jgi:hypothetical protein
MVVPTSRRLSELKSVDQAEFALDLLDSCHAPGTIFDLAITITSGAK